MDLIPVYKYLMRRNEGEGTRLFPVVPTNRTRGKEHKLKSMKFLPNTRKYFFTVRMVEHWHRLPREVVESPFSEIFITQLDTFPGNLL